MPQTKCILLLDVAKAEAVLNGRVTVDVTAGGARQYRAESMLQSPSRTQQQQSA